MNTLSESTLNEFLVLNQFYWHYLTTLEERMHDAGHMPFYSLPVESKGGLESGNGVDECENPEVGGDAEKCREITAYTAANLLSPI